MKRVDPRQLMFLFYEPPTTGRIVRRLSARGVSMTVSQWSKATGLTRSLIRARKRKGFSDVDAVTIPAMTRHSRLGIPDGHPDSVNWDRDEWENDDYAWYVVQHHPEGLSLEQIGAVMGLSDERVRQIIEEALDKLRQHPEIKAELAERDEENASAMLARLVAKGELHRLFFRSAEGMVA